MLIELTVWPPGDSGARPWSPSRARRKKNYMWKEKSWLAARASSTGPRERAQSAERRMPTEHRGVSSDSVLVVFDRLDRA
jgi:hypothetical protein